MNHIPPPFEACSLDEPFIFVSYSHKDTALVFPELEALNRQGYRIWYDEGIDPGNEWPEEIARALAGSAFFLVFISPDAVKSINVRNEINYALEDKKPFLAIHLTETILPGGLRLQIGSKQAILKYRMTDEAYRRKLAKILPDELVKEEEFEIAEETVKPAKPIIQPPNLIIPQASTPNTVTDIDGNVYKTVQIGNLVWTAENLKVTRLNDGTPIPNIQDKESWKSLRSPGYCFYDNDPSNKDKYGALYNFFAVETSMLAPKGWHVPTDEEWGALIKSLGEENAGKLLKAKSGWAENGNGTDTVGFSALPGGLRDGEGSYTNGVGLSGTWWSSTAYNTKMAWCCYVEFDDCENHNVEMENCNPRFGFSVRLVRL